MGGAPNCHQKNCKSRIATSEKSLHRKHLCPKKHFHLYTLHGNWLPRCCGWSKSCWLLSGCQKSRCCKGHYWNDSNSRPLMTVICRLRENSRHDPCLIWWKTHCSQSRCCLLWCTRCSSPKCCQRQCCCCPGCKSTLQR
jgi:hypothetical protein